MKQILLYAALGIVALAEIHLIFISKGDDRILRVIIAAIFLFVFGYSIYSEGRNKK